MPVVASVLVFAVVCVMAAVWAALAEGRRADSQARKMLEKRRDAP